MHSNLCQEKGGIQDRRLGETRMRDVRGDSFVLFLIVANFAMHSFYLFILKDSETYPRIGGLWENAVSVSV